MADLLDVVALGEAKDALKEKTNNHDARLASAITAVSRRLDDEFGPIVKRTIAVKTYEPCGLDLWVHPSPIFETPEITITDYDANGEDQLLTLEDYDTKPDHGYRLEARSGLLGGGYTGRIRRTKGSSLSTWGTVRVAYDAGRYATTDVVDPVFKEAALVTLINWWQQVLSQPPQGGIELDLPGYRFPGFALPRAIGGRDGIVPVDELAPRRVLA